MPELPEVESLRMGLESKILNHKILSCEIRNEKIISGSGAVRAASKAITKEFVNGILGKRIKDIKRYAKNLVISLNDDSVIVIHLKMTGQLVFVSNLNKSKKGNSSGKESEKVIGGHPIIESYDNELPNKHTHIIFILENGTLFYNDVRKFGYVLYYKNISEARSVGHFKISGLEPFDKDFTLKYFKKAVLKKNKSLKAVLLEQSVVIGCGNIYTDEVCHASHVLPSRLCKSLNEKEMADIYKNIKSILKAAIKDGGSSVSDYLLADGKRGNFAKRHKVYQKEKQKCQNKNKESVGKECGGIIKRIQLAGRSTFFCDICQN